MKGKKKVFLIGFLIFLVSIFWFSGVEAKSYYYDSINVEIDINEDSTFDVTEEMTYNLNGSFGFFYRDIELKNLDHLSDVRVFDSNGRELFEYDKNYNGNSLHIRWDFPRRDFNNELKSWTVQYKVHGGLGFFDEYDEIYWNAIFQDRDVNVEKAKVKVILPTKVSGAKLFIGEVGNKDEYQSYVINNNSIEFEGENIGSGEYLTIVANWPKGFVTKPFIYRNQLINWIVLIIFLLIPIVSFVGRFRKWWKDGRDPKITKTIIAQYEPPANLSPAILGVLLKEKVDTKDILATVIDLAVRGYVRIKEEEKKILFIKDKEYIFEKLKSEDDLRPFERKIMEGIFGSFEDEVMAQKLIKKYKMPNFITKSIARKRNIVFSAELRNSFYSSIPGITEEIHKEIAKENLFNGNIQETRKKYAKKELIGFVCSFVGFFVLPFILLVSGLSLYIFQALAINLSLLISFIIGMIFSYYMPVLTQRGLDSKWQALGFREYLHTAERFRIGTETLETFSKFLPYAMIFKVEKEWAERFSDFSYQNQSWYVPSGSIGGAGGISTPTSLSNFSSSFSTFSNSISSTFSSSPGGSGSGGGGSSGGGGGGGGGGAG